MTEAQKKKIIDTYNNHISKILEGVKNNALRNQLLGFQWGYDSILDILGYSQVFDFEGKCIDIKSYNKGEENEPTF